MQVGERSSGGTMSARAWAAAYFIPSVICTAPQDRAPLEQAGEDQHVVDLVGEVRAAGTHHGGPMGQGHVGHDLRHGVGHGQEDGVLGHGLHHLPRHQPGAGDPDEHIGPHQGVGQGAGAPFRIGPGGQLLMVAGLPRGAGDQDAVLVAQGEVPVPQVQQQLGGRPAGGPRCR